MRCLLCLRCVSVTLLTGFAVATVRYFSFWISNSLKIRELLKNVIQNRENVIQTDDYSLWGHRVFGSLWKLCQSKELLFSFRYRYPELLPTPPELRDRFVWSREHGSELDFRRELGSVLVSLCKTWCWNPQFLSSEPRSRLQTELSPNLRGVGKSSGYLYRKRKNNSFDWWGFQSDPSTLTPSTRVCSFIFLNSEQICWYTVDLAYRLDLHLDHPRFLPG